MATKIFRLFDDEGRLESIIGGAGRPRIWPEDLVRPARILVDAAETEAFLAACRDRPRVVEVGPGRGLFLNSLATTRPETVFLGVETRLGFCIDTLRRAERFGNDNVWIAWGDARTRIPELVPPGGAAEAYLLYPDPWWKHRHARRRHGPHMASVLAVALTPGGRLVLKSDVREYLEILAETFAADGRFIRAAVPENLPMTDRERRLSAKGMPSFSAAFIRAT